jgi:hypothetical protein
MAQCRTKRPGDNRFFNLRVAILTLRKRMASAATNSYLSVLFSA